jgi:hypothetical protein
MRRIIIFLSLLLFVSTVNAALDNDVFSTKSGWYHTEESIEVDGHNILITLKGGEGSEIIRLLFDDTQAEVLTSVPSCVRYLNLETCVDELKYDFKDNSDDWAMVDPRTKRITPGIKMIVNDLSPEIEVTRSVDDSTVYLGQKAIVNLNIKNNGDSKVEGFKVFEAYPLHMEIVSIKGDKTVREGSSVVTKIAVLQPGDSIDIEYVIRPIEDIDVSLKATFEYDYLGTKIEETTAILSLNVEEVLDYESTFLPESPALQNETTLIANLTNKDTSDSIMIREFHMAIPEGIEIIDVENVTIKDGEVGFEQLSIGPEESILFKIVFTAENPESYPFAGWTVYTYNDAEQKKVISSSVSFTNPNPTAITAALKFLGSNMLEKEAGKLWILLKNDDDYKYKDITINVSSPLFGNKTFYIEEFISGAYESVEVIDFTAPNVTEETIFTATLKGTAKSERIDILTGEEFVIGLSTTSSITIIPVSEAFGVTSTIEPYAPFQNDTVTVVVSVNNRLDRTSMPFVEARESVPGWLIMKDKKKLENVFLIEPGRSVIAYSYELQIPFYLESQAPNVTTTVTALDYTKQFTTTLPLQLRDPPVVTLTATVPSEVVQGVQIPVSYSVSNTGEVTAYNVWIDYRPTPGIEVIEEPVQAIDNLEEGETITLTKLFRPVKSGTINWEHPELIYHDMYGNRLNATIPITEISVDVAGSIPPLLEIEKNITFITPHLVNITLYVSNKGATATELRMNDSKHSWVIPVNAKSAQEVSYLLDITGSGNLSVPGAVYSYASNEVTLRGISEGIEIIREAVYSIINDDKNASSAVSSSSRAYEKKKDTFVGWAQRMGGVIAIVIIILVVFVMLGFKFMQKRQERSWQDG